MAVPTEKEHKLLEQFRQKISDLKLEKWQESDLYLVTWIRARENDLNKAEEMLRKSFEWRLANSMDTIISWIPPQNYRSELPFEVVGKDNEGRPVGILCLGIWDIRREVEGGGKTAYIRYVDQLLARMMEALDWGQGQQQQFIMLIDMRGLSLRQFTSASTLDAILETFRRFEANYPERLWMAYILNAARIFPLAFQVIKPLLSGRTLQKVKIYNSNGEKWKPVLLAAGIPKETLPTNYGGTNRAYDTILSGCVPHYDASSDDLLEVTVKAGGKLRLEYEVEAPNTVLRWEFYTLDFDIGFSVHLEDQEEVVTYTRLNCHLAKEEGYTVCQRPGKYTLAFDNTYSRMRSKALRYSVTLHPAQDQDSLTTGSRM